MQEPLLKKLEEFGLSEKEARVYLASLEIGKATADQIAKQSGVNRSTTYVQIEELMRIGLMSTLEEGKKTFFTAESPDNLKRLFERKKQELDIQSKALDVFVPELTRLYDSAGERPAVRFFVGKEGLMTMREETLKVKSKKMSIALKHDHMMKVFSKQERNLFTKTRSNRKIHSRVIYTKTGEDIIPVPPIEMRRVPEGEFPFSADIYIYDNHVAFASLEGSIAGVIIQSPSIVKSMLALYALAWDAAAPYEKK